MKYTRYSNHCYQLKIDAVICFLSAICYFLSKVSICDPVNNVNSSESFRRYSSLKCGRKKVIVILLDLDYRYAFRFSTSRQTLTCVPDTFFTALLNGRISSLRDEKGAVFIDRDPEVFSVILNYLRTGEISIKNINLKTLLHEAEFYGISPLVRRLILCRDLTQSTCGDILFYGYLPPFSMFSIYFLIVYDLCSIFTY